MAENLSYLMSETGWKKCNKCFRFQLEGTLAGPIFNSKQPLREASKSHQTQAHGRVNICRNFSFIDLTLTQFSLCVYILQNDLRKLQM